MKEIQTSMKTALLVAVAVLFGAAFARADSYSWRNLQSDIAGVALHTDSNLVNPWGMTASSGGTIWVANNGTGTSTLYHQDGTAVALVVEIAKSHRNHDGANPTGTVFNSTSFFVVTKNGVSGPSRFIFVSEDGSISGWNQTVDPTHSIIAVDNGGGHHGDDGDKNNGSNMDNGGGDDDHNRAIYKGAALGVANGHNFLFAANFHSGRVETYDESFHQVNENGFTDPNLPDHYAPFGIHNLDGQIFVTFAQQDRRKKDDVPGPGKGFVDVFDTSGNLIRRVVSMGHLNAPWGLALVNGELWVGNFGDGRINNYDPATGAFLETISGADGTPLEFDGLWDLLPLGGGVYFTAGIAGEAHGLFGLITENM
jgi:uncharacterized protein (TIGR03118 family)